MPIRQFRKDSKKGGCDTWHLSDAEMLLNPLSFQAVGKTRGWGKLTYTEMWGTKHVWEHNWHQFIDLLVDGLTIEDSLSKIAQI